MFTLTWIKPVLVGLRRNPACGRRAGGRWDR